MPLVASDVLLDAGNPVPYIAEMSAVDGCDTSVIFS